MTPPPRSEGGDEARSDPGAHPSPEQPRQGGPTELVEAEEGGFVERLSAGTATALLAWLIGIGAGSALLALWVFAAIVLGERLGLGDLVSGLGFYVSILGASGPVILWLTGRAQGHSLRWFVVTALKMGGTMLGIVVAFGVIAAFLVGRGIGLQALWSALLLAAATVILSVIWALATWSADWYIARARVTSD